MKQACPSSVQPQVSCDLYDFSRQCYCHLKNIPECRLCLGWSLLLTYELGSCFTPTDSTTWRSANQWLFLWYAELCLWKAPISMGTILFRHFNHSKTILTAAMYRQYCLVMYQTCGNQTCKDWGWTERVEASWVTPHVLCKPPVNAIISSGTLHKRPTTHEYWLSSTPCLIQQYHEEVLGLRSTPCLVQQTVQYE